MQPDEQFLQNRRAFLNQTTGALGSIALAHLFAMEGQPDQSFVYGASANSSARAGANRLSHHAPTADAVISLFQHGGPSQMDLFDPKPELTKHHGKPYEGDLEIHFPAQKGNVLGSPFQFERRGQSGIELCELLPHTATIVDDFTLIRSVTTESVDHESALRLIHSGKFQAGYPTWGSWAIYGLGTSNQNLPAYVVLTDPAGMPVDNVRNWTSGWLPAAYQGTAFRPGKTPVPNLTTPVGVTGGARVGQLKLLDTLNRDHLRNYPGNSELEARITNFEIAARMQTTVPEALDLSQETEATKNLYGLDNPATAEYGTRCLIARRLIERGVRFVQLFLAGQ
ncbi:MAG: DUF1501 domain-containing protein, partial [Planctomycetes bacterium]|nr:DUF1501 domain-containing protein [Planctomycetota bacterium]